MEMKPVESSNIAAVGHDAEKEELQVRFKNGATYAYDGVPADVYAALMEAESKGRFVNAEVKGKYPHRRL